MPHGDGIQRARVLRQQQDPLGKPVGKWYSNPIFDTRMYEVDFPNGSTDVMTTIFIAENLYSQIDKEGETYTVMKEILDHRKTAAAVAPDDGFVTSKNGQRHRQMTIAGWELKVRYRDGSTAWVPLKDLKVMNPAEVAKYTVVKKIDDQPAFAWWVHHVFKKRDQIIKKVKSQYRNQAPHGIQCQKYAAAEGALCCRWPPD